MAELAICLGLALTLAGRVEQVQVFAVYEPVFTPTDVELLQRVHPDLICRGWFKWAGSPDWPQYAPLAKQLEDDGILLQGGITMAALYQHENGIDDATFQDFVTKDPDGQPIQVSMGGGGWYHLALYNPRVREYLKADCRKQIDAGAQGIWYDEIEGTYDWMNRTGYDRYAVDAFREWLIHKYVEGQGWKVDDERWRTQFGIDLSLYGGSIRRFDYLKHLQTTNGADGKPLALNPPQGYPRQWATSPNPLFREWGYAWNRAAQGTFRFDTVQAMFDELVADARDYAKQKYARELVMTYNHNGTARPGVDFLQPHQGAEPVTLRNRLDGAASYLDYYERTIADAAEAAPGVPVVFFVDWPSEADRLTALSRSDQLNFLHLYLPEAYAAGGEFALPLRGYSYRAFEQDTIGALALLSDYYHAWFPLLRGSQPAGEVAAPVDVTATLRRTEAGTVLHLINHRWNRQEVRPRPGPCEVELPAAAVGDEPPIAVSTNWLEQRPVAVERRGDTLRLTVDLDTDALVIFPAQGKWRRASGQALPGAHVQATGVRAAAVAGQDGSFSLLLPLDYHGELECLETGERQPAEGAPVFKQVRPETMAAGVLLDSYGIPLRHSTYTAVGESRRTDAWGRFCAPTVGGSAVLEYDGVKVTVPAGVCEVRRLPDQPIVNPAGGLLGWWANWPDRVPTDPNPPATVEIAEHLGRPAMQVTFRPDPPVSWMNTNSLALLPSRADGLEVTYCGDEGEGEVALSCQVLSASFDPPRGRDTFYRVTLPRRTGGWVTRRFRWAEFVAGDGERLDGPRRLCAQFSPTGKVATETRVWVGGVKPYREGQDTELRQVDAKGTLAGFDVEDRFRGHEPLTPLAARSGPREYLQRFDGDEPLPYANWAGRVEGGPVLMSVQQVKPGRGGGHLKLTFEAQREGWANLNFPLPPGAAKEFDGLVLHLRVLSGEPLVRVAVHVHPGGAPGVTGDLFLTTDLPVEPGEWTEVALPWAEFGGGQKVDLRQATELSFQVGKPRGTLAEPQAIELDDLGLWRAAER